jgi:hypothetical protein
MEQTVKSDAVYAICPAMMAFGRFASAASPSTRARTACMTAMNE